MSTETNRKVFISFLGASDYKECQYVIDSEASRPVRYVQEAMLDYYSRHGWTSHDCAYILLTNIAKARNWENDGHKTKEGEVIKQKGLRECLAALELPMSIVPVENVPIGNDEKEIMSIFSTIFGLLQEGDELYFDITHGFRYLPMITLVLGNYSKFLKNVTVRWIGYGNFEGRNQATNIAQVVDLTSMSMLQDWTTAAADFINNGNAASVVSLTQQQLRPILREAKGSDANATAIKKMSSALNNVVNDFKYCRGFNIIEATNVKELKESLAELQECMIEPLTPLIGTIGDSVSEFDDSSSISIANGFAAARWCLDNNMSQQAATIMQETVISHICIKHSLDYKTESQRNIASRALNVKAYEKPMETWVLKYDEYEPFKSIIETEPLLDNDEFLKTYKNLAELRNDLNHCGMRNNPMKTTQLKEKLENFHRELYHFIVCADAASDKC